MPPLSVLAFVVVARAAESASAEALTYLALVAVPLLAALALGWLTRGARPRRALLGARRCSRSPGPTAAGSRGRGPRWSSRRSAAWRSASLLAAVTPPRWLGGGIVAMALADTALVVSDLLQRPNDALNAAHPAAGLPRLQSAVFGSAVMGYGDLFIAGVLGALLAVALRPLPRSCAARCSRRCWRSASTCCSSSSTSCRRRCRWRSR